MALSDFQILQHGPGQEDATWPYEAQLYFARQIEAEVRKDDEALIRQLVEALEIEVVEWAPGFLAGLYDSDEPTENAARTKILAALKSARARLEKAP
ncbi:hypothetical protein [Acidovorax sp.]|uniref:hypothetical protein n=1 Tax=Acidovorax sp. TaxID=1872122 RepID=UPI0031DA07C4